MLKRIITLSFFASLVACKAIPVSPYPGKMERWRSASEASVVDNTIYVFGGVEDPILEPYIVNPDDDDDDDDDYQRRIFGPVDKKATDIAYAYDIDRDQWRVETTTPFPWKTTNAVAIDRDIFLFSCIGKGYYGSHELWKYDTVKKNWSQKSSLPFLWSGSLHSCSMDKKIYFAAEGGYLSRNIIHVYNIDSDEWEQPIFINKKLSIEKMLCLDESIKVFAGEYKVNKISGETIYGSHMGASYTEEGVFTIHYNGTTLFSGIPQKMKQEKTIASLDEYFYFYETESEVNEATIQRVNTRTSEYEAVASDLPYNFSSILFVPTDPNQIFLFGGLPTFQNFGTPVSKDAVSVWSHKVVQGDQ
ncbi:hypothetical protein HPULCUR_011529 [Helicostylum pulchrum]|uniref:Kelch repeat-containing protein n=1 Tax=Helicostylum pulchrum TaxID=562976 RepID=A0ABP9YGE8_9FUNG